MKTNDIFSDNIKVIIICIIYKIYLFIEISNFQLYLLTTNLKIILCFFTVFKKHLIHTFNFFRLNGNIHGKK